MHNVLKDSLLVQLTESHITQLTKMETFKISYMHLSILY